MKLKILSMAIVLLMSIIGFGQNKKILGSMTVTDGMLNGQKTMLSNAELIAEIIYLKEGEAGSLPVVINVTKVTTNAVARFLNANWELTITLPLVVNAKGYLVTTGKAIVRNKDTGVINGKTTTKKVTLVKKNERIGHVTLLR